MRFKVINAVWGADGEEFAGGDHDVAKPTVAFLRLVAGAEAAGAIEVLEVTDQERAKLDKHIEPDEKSLERQQAAQHDGSWSVGNRAQHVLSMANLVEYWKGERAKFTELQHLPEYAERDAKVAEAEAALAAARAAYADLADHPEYAALAGELS